MQIATKAQAIIHYNENAPAMQNQAFFYRWVSKVVADYAPSKEVSLADIGAGTGALLQRLRELGYQNLKGFDFSSGCLQLARNSNPTLDFQVHDIELAALEARFDVLTMTTVLDFLENPQAALINIKKSLNKEGLFFVTIRNRWAYWPWYKLRHFSNKLSRFPRLHHWFLWFTTPLGLRRNDQPFEKVYAVPEARTLLLQAGLIPVAETGMMTLPMFWIPDLAWLIQIMGGVDLLAKVIPGKKHIYLHMFICKLDSPFSH